MIDSVEEMEAARAVLGEWLARFNNKDIEGLFSLYDPDSIYANAKAPLMRGLDEIKPWYANSIPSLRGTLHHLEEAAWQSGKLATILGSYYFEPPADEAAEGKEGSTGRVLLIFRKDNAGSWKLVFDMDNTPEDVSSKWFSDGAA